MAETSGEIPENPRGTKTPEVDITPKPTQIPDMPFMADMPTEPEPTATPTATATPTPTEPGPTAIPTPTATSTTTPEGGHSSVMDKLRSFLRIKSSNTDVRDIKVKPVSVKVDRSKIQQSTSLDPESSQS